MQTNQAAPPAETAPAVTEPIVGSPSTPPEKIDEILLTIKDLVFDTGKSDIKQENFDGLDKLAELLKKRNIMEANNRRIYRLYRKRCE